MKSPAKSPKSFSTSFKVARSPEQVFEAINDVRAWWTGTVTGRTASVGSEFAYRYEKLHRSTQKVVELVPGKKVVWEVTDSQLQFDHPTEWTGTRIEFELSKSGSGTEVRFTHHGLLPSCDCYEACSEGWTFLMKKSLKNLITVGKGAESWA